MVVSGVCDAAFVLQWQFNGGSGCETPSSNPGRRDWIVRPWRASVWLPNRTATINVTSFGRKRETFCDVQNFNLEGSDDEYMSLIRKLKESGGSMQSFLSATRCSFSRWWPEPKKEHVLKLSLTNRYEECYEYQLVDHLRDVVIFMDWNISQQDCDLIEEITREQHC